MPRVLVTGGTGVLGRELVPRLAEGGYTVRVMSRRSGPPGWEPEVEWAEAELESGAGLAGAVAGADVVVHCASNPFRRAEAVDVGGTARLLDEARRAGASHFVFISIVGIDRIPLGYYRWKLAAEGLIEGSGLPYSVLRATQFHTLIDRLLGTAMRLPVAFLPADFRFQPIDPGEVAGRLRDCVVGGPGGRPADIGGPEVHTLGELARAWAEARGLRRLLVPLPLPGRVAAGFRRGRNTVPENPYGRITWADWLRSRYGAGSQG